MKKTKHSNAYEEDFYKAIESTGVKLFSDGDAIVWGGLEGEFGGFKKPKGPLVGKKIGLIVAAEFSDLQAYELMHYIGEFGGICEFILVDWVTWKHTRPANLHKGIEGQWGLHVDPIITIAFDKSPGYISLKQADVKSYDALIVLGNHSADIMLSEDNVWKFIREAFENGIILGAIGEGCMPLIHTKIVNDKKVTGSKIVKFMLEKVAKFTDESVVVDGKLITARDTVNTPEFIRRLSAMFDPSFVDIRQNCINGNRVLMICGEDYEDIEMCIPFLELIYRGADLLIGTFEPCQRSRPGVIGADFVMGSVGTTIPIQEVPLSEYKIKNLDNIAMDEFDTIIIPGGFGPWNIIAQGYDRFIADAYKAGKVVTAICHGPIALAAAGVLTGKKCAGVTQCLDAIPIMGGEYHSEWSTVVDGRVVTSRMPCDIPEYLDAVCLAVLNNK